MRPSLSTLVPLKIFSWPLPALLVTSRLPPSTVRRLFMEEEGYVSQDPLTYAALLTVAPLLMIKWFPLRTRPTTSVLLAQRESGPVTSARLLLELLPIWPLLFVTRPPLLMTNGSRDPPMPT